MSVTFHTTAFVLRTVNQGEHDRRAHLYTLDRGKLDVFVKSARKFVSKLTPHLEPLTVIDCYIARGRVDHLAGIERLDRFSGLRRGLGRFAAACWAAELVDLLTKWDHADRRVFDLLSCWCVALDRLGTDRVPERMRAVFLLTLLSCLGYGLEWNRCAVCKTTVHDCWEVQLSEGGVVCGNCRTDIPYALAVTDRERRAFSEVQRTTPFFFSNEVIRSVPDQKANELIALLLQIHFDRPMNSERFLAAVAPVSFLAR